MLKIQYLDLTHLKVYYSVIFREQGLRKVLKGLIFSHQKSVGTLKAVNFKKRLCSLSQLFLVACHVDMLTMANIVL